MRKGLRRGVYIPVQVRIKRAMPENDHLVMKSSKQRESTAMISKTCLEMTESKFPEGKEPNEE